MSCYACATHENALDVHATVEPRDFRQRPPSDEELVICVVISEFDPSCAIANTVYSIAESTVYYLKQGFFEYQKYGISEPKPTFPVSLMLKVPRVPVNEHGLRIVDWAEKGQMSDYNTFARVLRGANEHRYELYVDQLRATIKCGTWIDDKVPPGTAFFAELAFHRINDSDDSPLELRVESVGAQTLEDCSFAGCPWKVMRHHLLWSTKPVYGCTPYINPAEKKYDELICLYLGDELLMSIDDYTVPVQLWQHSRRMLIMQYGEYLEDGVTRRDLGLIVGEFYDVCVAYSRVSKERFELDMKPSKDENLTPEMRKYFFRLAEVVYL